MPTQVLVCSSVEKGLCWKVDKRNYKFVGSCDKSQDCKASASVAFLKLQDNFFCNISAITNRVFDIQRYL